MLGELTIQGTYCGVAKILKSLVQLRNPPTMAVVMSGRLCEQRWSAEDIGCTLLESAMAKPRIGRKATTFGGG